MSRQVGFYLAEEDEQALLDFFDKKGLLALAELIPAGSVPRPLRPSDFRMPKSRTFFYLLPGELAVVEAFYQELPGTGSAKLLADNSPVIEFTPSPREGISIYDGRLYVGLDETASLYKSVSQKYDQLANAIRTWPQTDRYHFYVAPHAAERAVRGEIRLMHHRVELRLNSSPRSAPKDRNPRSR